MSPGPEGIRPGIRGQRDGAARAALALLSFLFFSALLARLMLLPAMDAGRMFDLFSAHARTAGAGVGAAEYPAISDALSGYLAGRQESPEPALPGETSGGVFSQNEIVHLSDVRELMGLSAKLAYGFAALLAGASSLFLRARMLRREAFALDLAGAALLGLYAAVAASLLLAVWSALDFERAFTLLHRVAFRNELWLLDPRQDLLIMLMPLPFFQAYALGALRDAGIVLLTAFAALTALRFFTGKGVALRRRT